MKRISLFILVVLLGVTIGPTEAEQEAISPKISFEQTVSDLGQVGLGTKNTCEFLYSRCPKNMAHTFIEGFQWS